MTGHVYINGQIGSTYSETGEVLDKGVELIDVVSQFAENGEVEKTIVHIDSCGGHVSVGHDIAQFIESLDGVFTSAENLCASMATEIFLSVPLQNRSIQENCEFIIHNPFMMNVTGDANQLDEYSKSIKATESEMINMYHKATGVSKEALSGLMKIETSLTAEQCIKLNFASSITKKTQSRAVALFYTQKEKQMSKPMLERIAQAYAIIKGEPIVATVERNALAMTFETDKGVLVTPYSDLIVGDPITLEDGTSLENGDYVTVDGDTITVTDGVVTAFVEVAEATDVNAEVEALKVELASVKAELLESKTVAETVVAKMEELAKIGSSYVPPVQATVFREVKNDAKVSVAEQMRLRKESLKK